MKRLVAPIAVGLAVLYLGLAVSAAGCVSLDGTSSHPLHHKSTSHVTHSALCAWACQANPAVAVISITPSARVLLLISLFLLLVTAPNTRLSYSSSLSRAPPC